jgi:hypothetical protein
MAISAAQIIETICPELSGSPSMQVYLGMAVEIVSRRFFGSLYQQAVAYMACHLFTMFSGSAGNDTLKTVKELGGGAPVASMTEGKLSVSFVQSAGATDGAALGSTGFGRQYLGLKKGRPKIGVNMPGIAGGF